MTLTHEQVLADIERQATTDGASLEQIDARIAVELGVPPDYYFAYLLVWGAIERHRELVLCQPGDPTEPQEAGGTPLQRAQSLADTIGWAASRIYGDTAGDSHHDINSAAAQLLDAALQLRAELRQLKADRQLAGARKASPPARPQVSREVSNDAR